MCKVTVILFNSQFVLKKFYIIARYTLHPRSQGPTSICKSVLSLSIFVLISEYHLRKHLKASKTTFRNKQGAQKSQMLCATSDTLKRTSTCFLSTTESWPLGNKHHQELFSTEQLKPSVMNQHIACFSIPWRAEEYCSKLVLCCNFQFNATLPPSCIFQSCVLYV